MIVLFKHVAVLLSTAARFALRGLERGVSIVNSISIILFHTIWCLCIPHVKEAMSPQLLDLHHVPMVLLLLLQLEGLRADPLRVHLEEVLGLGVALRVEPLLARDAIHLGVEGFLACSLSSSLPLR